MANNGSMETKPIDRFGRNPLELVLRHAGVSFIINPIDQATILTLSNDAPKVQRRTGLNVSARHRTFQFDPTR